MAQSLNLTKPFGFLSLLFGGIRRLVKDKTAPAVILHLYVGIRNNNISKLRNILNIFICQLLSRKDKNKKRSREWPIKKKKVTPCISEPCVSANLLAMGIMNKVYFLYSRVLLVTLLARTSRVIIGKNNISDKEKKKC